MITLRRDHSAQHSCQLSVAFQFPFVGRQDGLVVRISSDRLLNEVNGELSPFATAQDCQWKFVADFVVEFDVGVECSG